MKRLRRTLFLNLCATIVVCTLTACGSGGSGPDPLPPPPPPQTGGLVGTVINADTGAAIAGAKLLAGTRSADTDSEGRFRLEGIPAGDGVVRAEIAGFSEGLAVTHVKADRNSSVFLRLIPVGHVREFDASNATLITVPGTPGGVRVAADSLVDAVTGARATGLVTARLTIIDPSSDPGRMPGAYATLPPGSSTAVPIVSYGAIDVEFADSAGRKLNLVPGTKATLRIPVNTRSPLRPAKVPLLYLNEDTGFWVKEGTADLKGVPPQQYYEAEVTHFTRYNAGKEDVTVLLEGCVLDPDGRRIDDAIVTVDGVDYSGTTSARTRADGTFTVPARARSKASVYARKGRAQPKVINVTTVDVRVSIEACLEMFGTTDGEGVELQMAPVITSPPQDESVTVGGAALFAVTAVGTQPLKYQWLRDDIAMAGETRHDLWVSPAQAADDGRTYSVRVSNSVGSATSSTARLTVTPRAAPPTIVAHPQPATTIVGQTATFSVVASGIAPLSYQWKRNGEYVAAAIESSYTTPPTSLADNDARYSVEIENPGGVVTSEEALLRVQPASTVPTITRHPADQAAQPGSQVTFSVEAAALGTLAYQWQRDGADIPGATGSNYVATVDLSDDGAQFRVVVTAAGGSVTSNAAVLMVMQGDEETRARVLDFIFLWATAQQGAGASMALVDQEFRLGNPLCTGGTAAVRLDGTPAAPAQVLPPGQHVLSAQFDGCVQRSGETTTGAASATYLYTDQERLEGGYTGTATNLRIQAASVSGRAIDATVNGSSTLVVDGEVVNDIETADVTFTPGAGLQVRANVSSVTSALTGGSVVNRSVTRAPDGEATLLQTRGQYNALQVAVNGTVYVIDGTYQFDYGGDLPIAGSGTITIKAGGDLIARLLATNEGFVADARAPLPDVLANALDVASAKAHRRSR